MNKQRICPHCRSHPTLELSPRALTHQNKAPSGLSFARGRQAWIARLRQPLGLTLSTCAMRVCAHCVVWSLHHPHAAWSRYPTRHVFPRAARYTCPVHKCPIAGARACVRIRRRGSGAESPGDIERCSACGGHGHRVFRQQVATQPSDLPAGTGLTPGVHACHICTGTGLAPATSAHGTGLAPATSGRDHLDSALCAPVVRERCVCRTGRAGLLSAGRVSHTCAATVGSLSGAPQTAAEP